MKSKRNLREVTYDKCFAQKSRIMFLSDGPFLTLYSLHDPILAFPGVDLLQGIGQVLHFSAQGHIILRLTQAVRLGTRIFSSPSRPIGRVVDIFGPTSHPFAALKPEAKITEAAVPPGTNLFLKKAPKGGVGKRRKK